jgi:hypothetical protein
MHFVYGFRDGNARAILREYQIWYPDKELTLLICFYNGTPQIWYSDQS